MELKDVKILLSVVTLLVVPVTFPRDMRPSNRKLYALAAVWGTRQVLLDSKPSPVTSQD